MKIVIVGSEGFIGKSLSDYYRKCCDEVFCIDIIIKKESNYYCVTNNNFSFQSFFEQQKIDVCVNASGAANVSRSLIEPEWDYKLNVENVFVILNSIRLFSPNCKFIQISSAAVYGNPSRLPVTEMESIKPLSPYGFHKWQSELLCSVSKKTPIISLNNPQARSYCY